MIELTKEELKERFKKLVQVKEKATCNNCYNCNNCYSCNDCNDCYNCYNSEDCYNCNNCMLCYNLTNVTTGYYVLNKKVTEDFFYKTKRILLND